MENAVLSLTEHAHITEMAENLRRKLLEAQRKDIGRGDSLRRQILSLTVSESYDAAKTALETYIYARVDFPEFQRRAERYAEHCRELVQAIQTKRNFPGLSQLSLSKQQEIHEKVLEHFEELKAHLKQIERIERDARLTDMRSTVWVIRAFTLTAFVVCVAWFLADVKSGLFSSTIQVMSGVVDDFSFWVIHRLGF